MNPFMYPFPSGRDVIRALVLLDAIIKNVSKLVTKVMSRYRVREINWGWGWEKWIINTIDSSTAIEERVAEETTLK